MVNHQTIVDRNTHLSPEDLAALRDNLHEQRRFREDQLRQITAAASRTGRPSQRHSAARTEVQETLAACARMVLADVEAALDRISEDRYGTCHRCRHAIDRDRLRIVPQARYCALCQLTPAAGR
ncbi:TraR/DksA family transcriptional regulator [Streptomyces sp. NPDC102360]|uniref:TraR/DksA family transcriptional regulator n=1 Tax=Streptomyces sp. NPDC102360 TaxID=3366160 RepID=UPI003822A8B1